jgi:formylglycine-generating enzyme required for sulfatase activity
LSLKHQPELSFSVIPAQAGIHVSTKPMPNVKMDSRLQIPRAKIQVVSKADGNDASCLILIGFLLLITSPVLAKDHQILQDCPECPKMVVLPNGSWAFSQTEITFDQWQACVNAKGCRGGQDDHGWGKGQRPIINVNYGDALAYVNWLTKRTGKSYDLPDEKSWEYAALAGTKTAYPWGEEIGKNHANCRDCGSRWSGDSTAPVASFPPNPFGLYDMNGNVWEWTKDCWQGLPTQPSDGQSDAECKSHVIRGGAWYYLPPMAKSTARARFDISQWSYTLGIRIVRRVNESQ